MDSLKFRLFRRTWKNQHRYVIAAAAYRSGTRLIHGSRVFDFTPIKHDVVLAEILTPHGAPTWLKNRNLLWSAVEQAESRPDGILAREIVIQLPPTRGPVEWWGMARNFAQDHIIPHGIAVDLAIHEPERNGKSSLPHAHMLLTVRDIGPSGFRHLRNEWATAELHAQWRQAWQDRTAALAS